MLGVKLTQRRLVAGGLILGGVIRVGLVLGSRHSYMPVFDSADYSRIATSISQGHGFGQSFLSGVPGGSAFRTPVWPGLLAAVYAVVGTSWTAGRLLLAGLSTLLVAVIAALATKLAGRRVGLIALYLAAIYPPLLLAGYSLNYEIVLALLVCGSLLAGLHWFASPQKVLWLALAGVLVGLAILCRETAAFCLVPLWLWIWQTHRRERHSWTLVGRVAMVTGLALLVVVPWTLRNASAFHALVPVSDGLGYTLAGTYNATAARNLHNPATMWVPPTKDPTDQRAVRRLQPTSDEYQVLSSYQTSAIDYITAHPSYVPRVVVWNTVHLFDLEGPRDSNWTATYAPWPRHLIEASVLTFYLVGSLFVIGFASRFGRSVSKVPLTFPLLWCASVLLSVADIQYRLVIEPFLVLFAAVGIEALYRRWTRQEPTNGNSRSKEPS